MSEEKDIFSEIIRNKLSNYSLPVDDGSWNKIEDQLNYAQRAKTKRLWFTAIAAAASIALLFLLYPLNKKTYQNETANQLSNHEETIIQTVSEEEIIQPILQSNIEHPAVFRKSQPRKRLAENEFTVEVIQKEEVSEENQIVPANEESVVRENPQTPLVYDFNFGNDVKIPSIKNRKRQSVNLSFGSGRNLIAKNSMPVMNSVYRTPPEEGSLESELTYFRAATQEIVKTKTEELLLEENYSDVMHYPPLSFGVTIKKDLSRKVAIESGIVYSFLASSFSGSTNFKDKADLQLHYIGVPLNVLTRLYYDRSSKWGFYLSTGGMVEKGFLSHFVQKKYFNNDYPVYTGTSDEKIKGLQWSIGISPGFDYQIYKNYGIYIEPKLSYYFDNGQPESARTEHPVVIGINAGVRFIW